jgi:hypothetical protein
MHIQNVNIHIGSSAIGAAALAALMSFDATEPARTEKARTAAPASALPPPRIGEYWKGQGGVLVGIGRGYDGAKDHYLILPTYPHIAKGKKRMLGTYGTDVAGASSDHDGMANTIALAKAGSELCQEILNMEIEGHKDLYLMSRADARLCMANVPQLFKKDEWHLLSTQYSSYHAWYQYFGYGNQDTSDKKFEALWRPVRIVQLA